MHKRKVIRENLKNLVNVVNKRTWQGPFGPRENEMDVCKPLVRIR